jgi:two-component system chemotaxis response regulator CheY
MSIDPRGGADALRMLIVDDSAIMRMQIRQLQGLREVRVVGAAVNGADALRQFRNLLPDLVTLDITMPEVDGIACIEEMLRMKPGVRILVISALSDRSVAIEAIRRGAQGFLLKPINETKLNEALRELILD